MDQFMGQVRQLIPTIGTVLTTLGVISASNEAGFVQISTTVLGLIIQCYGFYSSYQANTRASILASASAMAEVDSKKLAAAVDDPTLKKVIIEAGPPPAGDKESSK